MTTGPIRLDIFSDPVCPWCYVARPTSTALWPITPTTLS